MVFLGHLQVLALVVKVDVEAFDASVECNNGLELARSQAWFSKERPVGAS